MSEISELKQLVIAGFEALGLEVEQIDKGKIGEEYGIFKGYEYKVTKKKKQRKTKEIIYSGVFLESWNKYPKRAGSNSKVEAFRAWNARHEDSACATTLMREGLERYVKFINASNQVGSKYVLQASTFFGPSQHYLSDWDIPKQETKLKLPFTNEELPAFAKENNLPEAGRTETYTMYRKRLNDYIATLE